jgi:hypothetical protein
MARAAIQAHPLAPAHGVVVLTNLPVLSPEALAVYQDVLSERLEQFPQPPRDEDPFVVVNLRTVWALKGMITTDFLMKQEWYHDLRHDAESVFWLLVWWAVHIRAPTAPTASTIHSEVWDSLRGADLEVDSRSMFLTQLEGGIRWLDPYYQGLNELFEKMARQLCGDYHWAHGETADCPAEMKDPEFLHEALQRLIFDFLLKNQDESFMSSEKHAKHRQTEWQIQREADLSGLQVAKRIGLKRSREDEEADFDGEPQPQVSHWLSPPLTAEIHSCSRGNGAEPLFLRYRSPKAFGA